MTCVRLPATRTISRPASALPPWDTSNQHQRALGAIIFHERLCNHHTGLSIDFPTTLPTAYRVSSDPVLTLTSLHILADPIAPQQTSRFHFYAVRRGHTPGVYYSWTSARAQVHGFSHNEHRGFNNLRDAWAYVGTLSPSELPTPPFSPLLD